MIASDPEEEDYASPFGMMKFFSPPALVVVCGCTWNINPCDAPFLTLFDLM